MFEETIGKQETRTISLISTSLSATGVLNPVSDPSKKFTVRSPLFCALSFASLLLWGFAAADATRGAFAALTKQSRYEQQASVHQAIRQDSQIR